MKHYLLVIGIMVYLSCNNSSVKQQHVIKSDTSEVILDLVLDKYVNNIPHVTAKRIIRDTLTQILTDSTNGKRVYELGWGKDTNYLARWYFTIPDSTGKAALKNKAVQDSAVWRWIPVGKNIEVHECYQLKQ